ncbi:MAG: hemerythrin domain-containing protein [Burkholderiales bacterium]
MDPFAANAAPGFDDPLGVLRACHRRIERQLATLGRLRRHLPEHHADHDARTAATAILRYFDTAAANHHADEEQSLFPRLLRVAPDMASLATALEREHEALAARWMRMRPLLSAIVARSGAYLPAKGVAELCDAYASHIAREEGELLPRAAEALSAADLAAIGSEMAARRDIAPAGLAL